MLPKFVLCHGKEEAPIEPIPLRAGPLDVLYVDGELRHVKLGDREIVQRVYVAVRDQDWGTVPLVLSDVQVDGSERSFRISFYARHRRDDIDFGWKGTICGDRLGTIIFNMDGRAHSSFLRNRIGFCLLHPMQACAGQPYVVETTDRTCQSGRFPESIAPHQPFLNIRAISHQVLPGLQARVEFTGDVFEMEDQRNWSDASFKTYCTPLALPFPVEISKGASIQQSVTLTLLGNVPASKPRAKTDRATFTVENRPVAGLPLIGLSMASHRQPLGERELARLKRLHLSHLRADLRLNHHGFEVDLQQVNTQAASLEVPMELAVYLSDEAEQELTRLVEAWKTLRSPVCRWLVFHIAEFSTSRRWVEMARRHLTACDPRAKIVSGTDFFFAELNRERPPTDLLDGVTYSLNPQVHASDDASLFETLEAQAVTVLSARQLAAGLPVSISTVTLKMRANPDAIGPEPAPKPGDLPPQVDERQMSLLGAAWTAGSLKYVAEGGASSVTYFETSGWRGVMETPLGSPLPGRFRSIPGSVFPMYHIFADVGEFAGGRLTSTRSSAPLALNGLVLRKDDRTRVIVANFSAENRPARLRNLGADLRMVRLNETNVCEAMTNPEGFRERAPEKVRTDRGELGMVLMPYEVVRLDW